MGCYECVGCGVCAGRCHIGAIEMVEAVPGDKKSKKAVVREDRCIGCGVCIAGCKKDAINLVRRRTIHVPPFSKKEQMIAIAMQKGKGL